MSASVPDLPRLIADVLAGDRVALGRAITLVESDAPAHRAAATELLRGVMPHTGRALRLAITGTPGVGKSTFIDAFGRRLAEAGHKLAVLAIDPSSTIAHGSILGDKTRMEALSRLESCFIRPSPSRGVAGGTASRTREAMLLCEAAGYDRLLIETVGVGQGEVAVRAMVDLFLLLSMPGTGDELQAIKRGIMELADAIVVNKADGEFRIPAEHARRQFEAALRAQHVAPGGGPPPVLVCSAKTGDGLDEVMQAVAKLHEQAMASGQFADRRREQTLAWLDARVEEAWRSWWKHDPAAARLRQHCQAELLAGRLDIEDAVEQLTGTFLPGPANERTLADNPGVANDPSSAYPPRE